MYNRNYNLEDMHRYNNAYNKRIEELKKVYELIQMLREYLKNPTEQNGTQIITESHELGLAIVNDGNTTTVTINDEPFVGHTLVPNDFIEKLKEIIPDTNLINDIEKLYSILIGEKGIIMKADENTAKKLLKNPQIKKIIEKMCQPIKQSKQQSKLSKYSKRNKPKPFVVRKVSGGKLKNRRTKVKKYKGGLDPLSTGLIILTVVFVVLITVVTFVSLSTTPPRTS
jgi:hypothetical protein